ncbi:MAG: hypothetical protein ACLPPF_17860, partial [Rhodomicrobium sp.]
GHKLPQSCSLPPFRCGLFALRQSLIIEFHALNTSKMPLVCLVSAVVLPPIRLFSTVTKN